MASRQPKARFKDRAELLDFLLDVTSATASAPDLDSVLASVSEHVRRVTPCDVFAILLYSERRKGLVVRYSFGLNQESFDDLVIPLDEGLTGVAASSKATVMVGDVKSDPRYLQALDAIQFR